MTYLRIWSRLDAHRTVCGRHGLCDRLRMRRYDQSSGWTNDVGFELIGIEGIAPSEIRLL